MKISVIGCGRWGSFIGWYLDRIGNSVTLCGRKGAPDYETIVRERSNGTLTFGESISLTDSVIEALSSDAIVISVPSQALRGLMESISAFSPKNKISVHSPLPADFRGALKLFGMGK